LNNLNNNKPRPASVSTIRLITNQNIDKKSNSIEEIFKDFNTSKWDPNNLKETLRNKRKMEKIEKGETVDTKKKMEELSTELSKMTNYISNMYKRYKSEYSTSSSDGKMNKTVDVNSNSQNNNEKLFSHEKRLSLPDNLFSKGSMGFSTEISKDSNMEEHAHSICFNRDNNIDNLNEVRSFKAEDDFEAEISNVMTENFEIVHQKLLEKESDTNFVIENFNILIDNEKEKEENIKIVKEYEQRETDFFNKLKNLENCLKFKQDENLSLNMSLQELMNELEKGELQRKRLHNYIQNLRGNLRVYCRVKPLTSNVINIYL
jgi:kinesin family protein C1